MFAAVWLSLALQPCAMAMGDDHDCPHCPPEHEHEMASHHGHAAANEAPPCASLEAQCGDIDDVIDSRTGKLKAKDISGFVLAVSSEVAGIDVRGARCVHSAADPPLLAGSSPPLHVLHCVYLN